MEISKKLFGYFLDDANATSIWATLYFAKGDKNKQLKTDYEKHNPDAYIGEIMAYILFNDGTIDIGDAYEDKFHIITKEKADKGFELLKEHHKEEYDALVEIGDYDADTCDLWLQYTIFGELVYG